MATASVLDVLKKASAQGLLEQQGEVLSGPGVKRDKQYPTDKLTTRQSERVKRAQKHAIDTSVKQAVAKQNIIQQQQQMLNFQMNMQKQQALALMCRVYVGSISFEVREDTVRTAFAPFGPIKSLSLAYDAILQKHKGFSFVEYELPEAAQMAIDQMSNALLAGRNIKVGRPTNIPQALPIIEQLSREAQKYNRIYLASVHSDLSDNDIQSVFESFGRVVSCSMVPDAARPGKHRGFGFIEYDNPQACVDAITSMNLFDLGGQYIRVGRAVTPPGMVMPNTVPTGLPQASALAAAQVSAKLTAMDALYQMQGITPPSVATPSMSSMTPSPMSGMGGIAAPAILMPTVQFPSVQASGIVPGLPAPGVVAPSLASANGANAASGVGLTDAQLRLMEDDSATSLEQQENMKISGTKARHLVMHKLMRRSESRVMVLRNMVGPEDIDETLEGEVTEECGRYGQVEKVIIYQEKQSDSDDADILVKIFVEFAKTAEVEAAVQSLNGRFFGGRTVSAQVYDQALYDANDLSE